MKRQSHIILDESWSHAWARARRNEVRLYSRKTGHLLATYHFSVVIEDDYITVTIPPITISPA